MWIKHFGISGEVRLDNSQCCIEVIKRGRDKAYRDPELEEGIFHPDGLMTIATDPWCFICLNCYSGLEFIEMVLSLDEIWRRRFVAWRYGGPKDQFIRPIVAMI